MVNLYRNTGKQYSSREKVLNKSLVYDVSIKTFTVILDIVGSYKTKCKFQK